MQNPNYMTKFISIILIFSTNITYSVQQNMFKVLINSTLEIGQFNFKTLSSRISNTQLGCVSSCSKEYLCEFAAHDMKNRSVCYLSYSKLKDIRTFSGLGSIHFFIKKSKMFQIICFFISKDNISFNN